MRILRPAALLLSLSLLAAPAMAQGPCSDLTVTGGAAGTTATFDLTGADPNAPATLAVGSTAGTTTFNIGPLGTLSLGLATPFGVIPMGMTDANGDVSLSLNIPSAISQQVDLFGSQLQFPVPRLHQEVLHDVGQFGYILEAKKGCGPF